MKFKLTVRNIFIAFTATRLADFATTYYMLHQPGTYEMNPVVARAIEAFGVNALFVFLALALASFWFMYYFIKFVKWIFRNNPSKTTVEQYLLIYLAISAFPPIWNTYIMLKYYGFI